MRTKANDGGIRQNSDEDLWLEHVIRSWDFKGFCQTNQAPRQSVEDFIKDHLSCAVVLKTDFALFKEILSFKTRVTLYFKVSLLQCKYTLKYWVMLINYMYLLYGYCWDYA